MTEDKMQKLGTTSGAEFVKMIGQKANAGKDSKGAAKTNDPGGDIPTRGKDVKIGLFKLPDGKHVAKVGFESGQIIDLSQTSPKFQAIVAKEAGVEITPDPGSVILNGAPVKQRKKPGPKPKNQNPNNEGDI